MKIARRIILIGLAALVVLGVGLYVGVRIALPPAKIREIIRVKGTEALGRPVTVGDIGVRLIPLKLVVGEINLANAPGFSPEPAVKLRQAELSVSLLSLLRLSPVVHQIKLVSPEILYEVDAGGRNNLEGLGGARDTAAPAETSAVALPVGLSLESFVIVDGKVRHRDAHSGREIALGGIHQDMSLRLDPRLENVTSSGLLEIAEVAVRDSASGLRKGGIRVAIRHDVRLNLPGEELNLNVIELSFQDIRARVEGAVTRFRSGPPEVDLRLEAPSISLASVLKEVPEGISPEVPKLKAAGQASLKARVNGRLDSASPPEVEASFQIRDGSLSHADVPLGVTHLEIDAAFRHDSLNLSRLSLDMGQNPVRVEALVSDARSRVPLLEKLAVDAVLDLGSLAALAQRMGLLDKSLGVAGTETIRLQASGPLDAANPQKLSARGTVELRAVTLSLPDKPTIRVDGKSEITNERIQGQWAAGVGQSDVNVKAEVGNYLAVVFPEKAAGARARARVEVRSGLLDLDELLPGLLGGEPEKPSPPLKEYPPLPPVDADLSVDLDRTRLMGLEMTRFRSQTSLRAGGIKTEAKGTVYSGSLSSSLSLTPVGPADMGVAVKLDVSRVEANDFISRLNDHVPPRNALFKFVSGQTDSLIYGKFSLDADLVTHGLPDQFAENLGGGLSILLSDGRIMETDLTRGLSSALSAVHSSLAFHQLNFSAVKAEMLLEGGSLLVRDFRVESSPIGSMRASGKVGFDNSLDLELTQALPAGVSKLVSGAGSALTGQLSRILPEAGNVSLVPTDPSGRAQLYYLVRGTLLRPSFSLDAQRMAREGAGSAKAALQQALRQKEEELKARVRQERDKLESEAKARIEAEKARLEAARKRAEDSAKAKVREQGKKVLKNLGF